uniref:Choline/carnitine acyltransferase domain-containing protein n=1 Tax=Hyaloperonospora arabidopsidis (strain Emoy2) TaxID=559515 RepID=M4BX81_HYAAE
MDIATKDASSNGCDAATWRPLADNESTTFRHQTDLPKLPIPTLKVTCGHFLASVAALQTPEEQQLTARSIETFLASDGPRLQQQLLDYEKDKVSFIEDFWYEAYLNHRSSVVLNVNPFFVLEDDPTPSRNNQLSRAASLILGALKFVYALRKGTLEPDMWRGNMALCMHQYKRLFGCARVPSDGVDDVMVDELSKHIVVVCGNQFYWFDVVWKDGVTAITERELLANLRAIHDDALKVDDVTAASNAVGVLTTERRSTWACLRAKLQNKNKDILAVIDRALFLVCLDTTAPLDAAASAATVLHGTYNITKDGVQTGTCMNRWYDKLQLIVCENGVAGCNFEHAFVDGHTVLRFVSDVFTDTIIRFAQTIRAGNYAFLEASYRAPQLSPVDAPDRPRVQPHKLEWVLDRELQEGIKFAEAQLTDLMLQNEVKVLEFTAYGKLFITQHNMSPDAFVQMAFIAAYYFQYGNAPCIYEPVLTKRFLHGRTEAARAMTVDALEFVKVFFSDKTPLEKIESLRKAISTHVSNVRNCAVGKGPERHLYALECLWQREKAADSTKTPPALFVDDAWRKLNHSVLSTSNCGNPSLRLFGFGPVVHDGFGIGYIIKDEGIQFCASSRHRQTERYLKNLESFLLRVQDLLMHEEEIRFPHSTAAKKEMTFKGYGFFDDGGQPTEAKARASISAVGKPLG